MWVQKLLFNSTKKVIYEQVIALLIGQKKQPKIIADWSPIPNTKLYVLRASLIARGRGLTLYEEVHTEKKQNNTMVQNKFLKHVGGYMVSNKGDFATVVAFLSLII